ncbi:hypothetical protein [Ferruginibacter sp. HRS2-29]|uniref:hypothetical protein n=1 Tax=Ferruginibacter sp. HRS2-29 TaxID=2487334 RepID=UPI0020CD1138|nr:hypothetical protein [Ferruginibacter sp. HRS2-29]MCP9749477.1 hypothetical protein [Ferruginibacter sp. HRS2-29]
MFKIILQLSLCSCIFLGVSYAQPKPADVLPPSPRASAFHLYGDYPVSFSRGLANISIPLYTINVHGKEFPITLRYHHSGIKFYSTEESNVATGWQIDFGGLISVMKLGKNDFSRAFTTHSFSSFSENVRTDFDELQKIFFNNNLTSELDAQRDIYSYDFFGNSGKFIYDNLNNKVSKFVYNNLDFKMGITNNLLSYIDAYDETGLRYRFGKNLVANTAYAESSGGSSTSLLLTDVEFPEGDKISYIYKAAAGGYRTTPAHYAKVVDYLLGTAPPTDPTGIVAGPQVSVTPYSTMIIQEITFPNGKVVFSTGTGTERISQIDIYNNTGIIKTIKFNTTDFDGQQKRFSLNSLEFKDPANNNSSVYSFEYNTGRFPTTANTTGLDYWGYYNGQTSNVTLVPNFSIPYRENVNDVPANRPIYSVLSAGCNRNVNETLMQAYILKKITYPTGGNSQFFYEANRWGATNKLGGGLRIQKIINNDGAGNSTTKTYEYGQGYLELNPETSENYLSGTRNWGQTVKTTPSCLVTAYSYRTRYYAADMNGSLTMGGGNQVVYSDVTEYIGTASQNTGRTRYKFENYGNGYAGFNSNDLFVPYLSSWNSNRSGNLLEKVIEKKKDDGNWDFVQKTTNTYSFISKDVLEGLNIDRILDLPESYTALACNPTYTLYGGTYINYDAFIFFRDNYLSLLPNKTLFRYYSYSIPTGYYNLMSTTTESKSLDGILSTTTSYVYGIPDFLQPTKEISQTSKNTTIEKRNKYVFSSGYAGVAPYNAMILKNMVNPVLEQSVYSVNSGVETLLQTSNTIYKQYYSNVIKPEKNTMFFGNNASNKYSLMYDYDVKGNLIMQRKENDVPEIYLWGYGGNYLIAKVVNSDYATVSGLVDLNVLNDVNSTQAQVLAQLTNLRSGLATTSAQVTTYTHKPLIGKTSETDINGHTTYYEYDSHQRLALIRDQDNNVVKKFCYNYSGQPVDCSSP